MHPCVHVMGAFKTEASNRLHAVLTASMRCWHRRSQITGSERSIIIMRGAFWFLRARVSKHRRRQTHIPSFRSVLSMPQHIHNLSFELTTIRQEVCLKRV